MIRASRYNELIDEINGLWSVGHGNIGYGQVELEIARVSRGDPVRAEDWTKIESVLNLIEWHQTGQERGNNPRLRRGHRVDIDFNRTSGWYDRLFRNRLASHTLANRQIGVMRRNKPRRGNHSEQMSGMYRVGFNDADHAGFFFNSGGFLQLALHQSRLWTDTDHIWTHLFDHQLGSILFHSNHTRTLGRSGYANRIGYYDLGDTFQSVCQCQLDSDRSITVDARVEGPELNGRPGDSIIFRIILNDVGLGGFDMLTAGTKLVITGHKSIFFESIAYPSGSVYDGWN